MQIVRLTAENDIGRTGNSRKHKEGYMATAAGQVGAAGAQEVSRRSVEQSASECGEVSSAGRNPVSAALEAWRGMLQTRPENAPWSMSRTEKPERAVMPAQDDTAELWVAIEALKHRLEDAERNHAAANQEWLAREQVRQSQQQASIERNRLRQVERSLVEMQLELTRARVQREKAEATAAAAKAQVDGLTAQLSALRSINGRQRGSRSGRS